MTFHWFLPTSGDGDQVGAATVAAGAARHDRAATVGYLAEVARAAEAGGFPRVLTPVGSGCPDPWIVCAAVAQHTERLGCWSPSAPVSRCPPWSPSRPRRSRRSPAGGCALNIVTGGDPTEQRAYGDFLDHDARYARTGEFLEVLRRCLARRAVRLHRRALPGRAAAGWPAPLADRRRSTSAARPRPPRRSPPGRPTRT